MLCKILIINMLDYKFKRFIFNNKVKLNSHAMSTATSLAVVLQGWLLCSRL